MRKICAAVAFALISFSAAPSISATDPPLDKTAVNRVCSDGYLDRKKYASWLFYGFSNVADAFPSDDAVFSAFAWLATTPAGKTAAQPDKVKSAVLGLAAVKLRVAVMVDGSGFTVTDRDHFDAEKFLADTSGKQTISCAKPEPTLSSAKNQAAAAMDNVQVRSAPDSLGPTAKDNAYALASGAAIALAASGAPKTYSRSDQIALGYNFATLRSDSLSKAQIIGFASVNENIVKSLGKKSSNIDYHSVGFILLEDQTNSIKIKSSSITGASATSGEIYNINYQHIWNEVDSSQQEYIHLIFKPYSYLLYDKIPVNAYTTEHPLYIIFDIRGDFGFYTDRGLKPSANKDYQQLGTSSGLGWAISDSSTLTITETALAEAKSYRKSIKLFDAALNIAMSKYISLKTSYENGNLEATAQRSQQWKIGLSAKY